MKKLTQFVCLLVVLSMVLVFPAAATEVSARGSDYFGSRSCYLYRTSSSSFQVWFDVVAVKRLDELGANQIKVQRSTDGVNWTTVKTYTKADYPNLVAYNTGEHGSYVTYSGATSGYLYRAYVEFYAKSGSNSAIYISYTSSI